MELKRLAAYRDRRATLDPDLLRELKRVEDRIEANPYDPEKRIERFDGCIVDFSGYGLTVAYRMVPDEWAIELVELVVLGETYGPTEQPAL